MVMLRASDAILPATPVVRSISEGGRRVLDLLLKRGGLSQAEITRSLDLSQPTIARLLQGFARDGIVHTAARPVDRPGNPSVHVTLNPDFAYGLGVSMLGDKLGMTLMDFTGRVRAERSAAMPSMSEAPVVAQLGAFKASILEETGIDPRRLVGAGVGLSGFFVGEGRLQNTPSTLDDWALRDVDPILEAALGLPVTVDNDANLAAVGESLLGVGRRCSNFAYLHLTNGFGGGNIIDGRSFRGYHGNAGEFGGIWNILIGISPDIDAYPNLDLLRACLAEHGRLFDTVEDMVLAIDATWPGVDAWLDKAAPSFTLLCDIIAYCNDPQVIVIGGRAPRSIAEALKARISLVRDPNRRGRPPPVPEIAITEIEGDAVSIGAAAVRLQEAFFL